MHRRTVVVGGMGVAHAFWAGTDATTPWLRGALALTAAPIVVLFAARLRPRRARRPAARPHLAPEASR